MGEYYDDVSETTEEWTTEKYYQFSNSGDDVEETQDEFDGVDWELIVALIIMVGILCLFGEKLVKLMRWATKYAKQARRVWEWNQIAALDIEMFEQPP